MDPKAFASVEHHDSGKTGHNGFDAMMATELLNMPSQNKFVSIHQSSFGKGQGIEGGISV